MGLISGEGFIDAVAITDVDGLKSGLSPTCTVFRLDTGDSTNLTVTEIGTSGIYKVTNWTPDVDTEYFTVWFVSETYTVHYPFKLFKVGGGQEGAIKAETALIKTEVDKIDGKQNSWGAVAGTKTNIDTIASRVTGNVALDNTVAKEVTLDTHDLELKALIGEPVESVGEDVTKNYLMLNSLYKRKVVCDEITSDGSEQTLFVVDAPEHSFYVGDLCVEMDNHTVTETVLVKVWLKIEAEGDFKVVRAVEVDGEHDVALLSVEIRKTVVHGVKLTIEKTAGTNRDYKYYLSLEEI